MPFRRIQKLRLAGYARVIEPEDRQFESGEIVQELIDQAEKSLPEPELFDLNNQMKAGISLEEVNSAVMSGSTVDAAKVVRKYTKKVSTETKEE